MAPLFDYECLRCHREVTDELAASKDACVCPVCGGAGELLLFAQTYPSTYTIKGPNGASTKPKRMGGSS
jgi:hypothetical protein